MYIYQFICVYDYVYLSLSIYIYIYTYMYTYIYTYGGCWLSPSSMAICGDNTQRIRVIARQQPTTLRWLCYLATLWAARATGRMLRTV